MERVTDILKDAEDFLGTAMDLFETKRWAKVCFNSHQCVELAIKAALNALGLERKGQYYIPTRYANAFYSGSAMEHYTMNQAREALKHAEEIFREISDIVTKRKTLERGEGDP